MTNAPVDPSRLAIAAESPTTEPNMLLEHRLPRHLLDEILVRRFIHPSEWVGVAVLIFGTGIALWKLATAESLSKHGEQNASWLARLIARFID